MGRMQNLSATTESFSLAGVFGAIYTKWVHSRIRYEVEVSVIFRQRILDADPLMRESALRTRFHEILV